jgi:hypothetical protein
MNSIIEREYEQKRRDGWSSDAAYHHAKVEARWYLAQAEGLVRAYFEPDCCLTPEEACGEFATKADIAEARRLGVWGFVSQTMVDGEWVTADSIWGLVGEDAHVYEAQVKQAALDLLDESYQAEADKLALRATYAGVST